MSPALPRKTGREAIGQLVSIERLRKASPTLLLLPREEAVTALMNPRILRVQTYPNPYSSLLGQSPYPQRLGTFWAFVTVLLWVWMQAVQSHIHRGWGLPGICNSSTVAVDAAVQSHA